MTDFKQRLLNLSPDQRQRLLDLLKPHATPAGEARLVAWVSATHVDAAALRTFLQAQLPDYMVPADFVLLEALPRTPNGKLDRQALPDPAPPEARGLVEPRSDVEALLAEIWAEVLGMDLLSVHDNFFEIGGDSLMSIQIVARARRAGLKLAANQLFECPTIAELAAVVDRDSLPDTPAEVASGPTPLTPIQHWLFEQNLQQPAQWNQAFLLRARQPLDPNWLQEALVALVAHHPSLRSRFVETPQGWQQEFAEADDSVPFEHLDLSHMAQDEQAQHIEMIADEYHRSLSLDGDLLRFAQFDSNETSLVLMLLHHLIVDAISWRILLEDLQTAYQQLEAGQIISLPPQTASYTHWSQRLVAYARSDRLAAERDYWLAERFRQSRPLPRDIAPSSSSVAETATISLTLDRDRTQALHQLASDAFRINDLLLAALGQTLAAWAGSESVLLALEGHGREALFDDLDVSRTVGWFTSVFPVALAIRADNDPAVLLRDVQAQLSGIPYKGIGHGILRHLEPDYGPVLAALPEPELVFNYLGQMDDGHMPLFSIESTSVGEARYPGDPRRYLIEINSLIREGSLQVTWNYSSGCHHARTIETLAQRFITHLVALITHNGAGTENSEGSGYSASDFQAAYIDQDELDDLLADLED